MQAEALNSQLSAQLADIDAVLESTLSVDDHVDLTELRQVAEHPRFTSPHQNALTPPASIQIPPEPIFQEPPAPTGLGAVFSKKKHTAAVEKAWLHFAERYAAWQAEAGRLPMRQHHQMMQYQAADVDRKRRLAADHANYEKQCRQRQQEVDGHNARLDELISKLTTGDQAAVEEYFGIVFGNSVYPDSLGPHLSVEYSYRPDEKELDLVVGFPAPADLPTARSFRYVKAKDEILETPQSAKEQKDRYNNLVFNITLRTLHEVWESDRLGHVDTISLIGGVGHLNPATGHKTTTPLVAAAVDRAKFEEIDLAHVNSAETLKYLRAVVSKNPHAFTPIDTLNGVRG